MEAKNQVNHYTDVIMTTIGSQITSLTVVYSTVYSDADQRKHQSSASLAFVWGIHRDRWIPRTKGQLRGKCFHLMTSSWSNSRMRWYAFPNTIMPLSVISNHHEKSRAIKLLIIHKLQQYALSLLCSLVNQYAPVNTLSYIEWQWKSQRYQYAGKVKEQNIGV